MTHNSHFANQTLYVNAACYNMLKYSGLIVDELTPTIFTGFSNMDGVQPIRVKVLSSKKLPKGTQMILEE